MRIVVFWGIFLSSSGDAFLFGQQTRRVPEANELFHLLSRTPIDETRASQLVDSLIARRRPFDAELLGGGLWLSLYFRGPTPRWADFKRVGQQYDPNARTVRNYGEIFGRAAFFSAEGSFAPASNTRRSPFDTSCPIEFDVDIVKGGLTLGPFDIDLGIKGPGLLRVLYIDDRLRVFESPTQSPDKWEEDGLIVVQLREDALFQEENALQKT